MGGFLVKADQRIVDFAGEPASALNQGHPSGDIPFIFGSQCPSRIGQTCRHEREFVGNRAHGPRNERGLSEAVPVSSFYFATAGKHYCFRETATVGRADGFAIEGNPLTQSAQDRKSVV